MNEKMRIEVNLIRERDLKCEISEKDFLTRLNLLEKKFSPFIINSPVYSEIIMNF